MITIECPMDEIKDLINEYVQSLSSPFDSFLEEHILASVFYKIEDHTGPIGYYAIHKEQLLTQFYIRRSCQNHAQSIFSQVLERHKPESLFVPTCDELFISLALDKDFSIHEQAYFFQEGRTDLIDLNIEKDEEFRPATAGDLQQIKEVCGDFLDQYDQRIAGGELFTYYRGSLLLGIGVFEQSKMFDGLASIGMYTNEAYRQQGIGRSLILHLRKWCKEQGIIPVCGCWYYNHASKQTLESAGMVTKTRLLNIKTTPNSAGS